MNGSNSMMNTGAGAVNSGMPVNNTRKNNGGNKSLLNSAKELIGLSGGKRKGTRNGRKGTRKGTRKAQKGGKRGLSGYMKFAAEQRKNMPKTSNVVSQAREIGKRWRALSEAEKSRYKK